MATEPPPLSRRSADALLLKAWQQTPDFACALLDSEGIIIGWYGAAEVVFGYTEKEVVGQSIDLIFSEEDRKRGLPLQERVLATTNGRAEDDRWHVRRDGAKIWVSGALVALRENDMVIGFAKIVRNRTDLKMQIEAARNRIDRLENDALLRERSFARFVHELRNSLAPLKNAVELIAHTPECEPIKFPLVIMRRQLLLMENLARDLSEIAQSNAGKLRLTKEQLNLGAELQQIVDTVRPRAECKRQELSAFLPPTPTVLWADRQRLHQIVFNLLDNAIKYTGERGHVWLKCFVEDTMVLIKVEDDGAGIPKELLPVIFDLFTQEVPEQSEGGFGVGLSLVKDLVEAHRGIVEARSQGKGRGSEFTVRLPIPGEPNL